MEDEINPILEYWRQISAGEIVVGDKIRKLYKKLAYDVEHPGEWFYSPKRAGHIIEFIERYCRHSKGKLGGKPVLNIPSSSRMPPSSSVSG